MEYKKMANTLGTWLVKEGVITGEQLDHALRVQSEGKGGMLGKILVKLGYCTDNDIARVMAIRSGISLISLESFNVNTAAVATLSAEDSKRYKALPIAFDGDKLMVAMQRPTDIMAIDDMRILTGFDIKPVALSDSELEAAIEKYSLESIQLEQGQEEPVAEDLVVVETGESAVRPAIQMANMIIAQAVSAKASDVHIEPYEKYLRIRFRIDGMLHDMFQPPRRMHGSLVSRIKVMANMDIAERRIPQDGRMSMKIEGRSIDIRVASLPTSYGERMTLRLLDRSSNIITLEELGVAPEILAKFREALKIPYGFILVTGPTGSGKSTTLYAGLSSMDRISKNVITVEDPVEYRLENMNQIQINPKAGLTFATGLRSILRNDPDIIMVGEIRDKETARIAIESALTGHLVFSTLHTNDAAGAISRFTEMGIEPFITVSSLACIMAQRLARVLCHHCKQSYVMTAEELALIPGFPLDSEEKTVTLYHPSRCVRCNNIGYKGRVGIYEVLFVDEKIQQLIMERKSAREIKAAAVAGGMVTLRRDGLMKAKQGITSLEEIMRVVL